MLPLSNLYKYIYLNDTELRSLTNIITYKHNPFWIFFFFLILLSCKNKISIKQVKGLQKRSCSIFFFFFGLFIFVIIWSDIEI